MIARMLLALLATVGIAHAGDLKQLSITHNGQCDDTYHEIRMYTNTTGRPIRAVSAMLLNGGSGGQGAYLARRSDRFFFMPSGYPSTSVIHHLAPGHGLVIGPGDGLDFVHWCSAPDYYGWLVFVDYID